MDLADAVSVLQEMGDLLEIVESNRFEILSYRDAARFLEEHERLRALFPPGLPDLLSLWGSAPRGFGSSGRDRGRQFGVLGRGCPSE